MTDSSPPTTPGSSPRTTLIWLVPVLLVAIPFLAALSQVPGANVIVRGVNKPTVRIVQDATGTEVRVPNRPVRIVSVSPAADEMLFELVPARRIAAITAYSATSPGSFLAEDLADWPTERTISSLADSVERIVTDLQPDLLIATGETDPALRTQLAQARVPVVTLHEPTTIGFIFRNLIILGEATGTKSEAEELVRDLRRRVLDVQQAHADTTGPRVAFLTYYNSELATVGPGSTVFEALRLAGYRQPLRNLGGPWPTVTGDTVLGRADEIDGLLVPAAPGDEPSAILDTITTELPGFDQLPAIAAGRTLVLPTRYVMTSSHHLIDAVEWLAEQRPALTPPAAADPE